MMAIDHFAWTGTAKPLNVEFPRDMLVGTVGGVARLGVHVRPITCAKQTVTSDLHGFSLRMLMDANFGAMHFNLFVVGFPDGGLCNHHDHPFEETYFMLEGEVDCVFEGQEYTL